MEPKPKHTCYWCGGEASSMTTQGWICLDCFGQIKPRAPRRKKKK